MKKRQTQAFAIIVLACLAFVAVINLMLGGANRPKQTGWLASQSWSVSILYNLDFATTWLSRLLYPLGISTDPSQVIIGRNEWLFLGDRHEMTLSAARRGQTSRDNAIGRQIGNAAAAWDEWLKQRGVSLYRVMLAPNKSTIYPEYLPDWATPKTPSAADALMLGTGSERYIDLRPALLSAKVRHKEAVYYRTDTHWNSLGAANGFLAFSRQVSKSESSLRWPLTEEIHVAHTAERRGGDLARFLRMSDHLTDLEPKIEVLVDVSNIITQYDFDTGKAVASGGHTRLDGMKIVLKVTSPQALNNKKVLWLRDSFGDALAPLMAATFTETVQLHWSEALGNGGRRFVEIVEAWQPDYVFVTVVERAALSPAFSVRPPE